MYAHEAIDGIEHQQCVSPAFSKSLLQLTEAGVEVVDLRQACDVDGPYPAMHPGDHHWTTGGNASGSKNVRRTIRRYSFPPHRMG